MHSLLNSPRLVQLGLGAVVLILELSALLPQTSFAQTQPGTAPAAPLLPAAPVVPAAPAVPVVPAAPRVCPGSSGPADYAVSGGPTNGGGWFYTEEACRWQPIEGLGPTRARGYAVLDDAKGNFWTEFRRFGGVEVLGYPVSQPYHYPIGAPGALWYQAFQRGILQYHPETGRADLANVFEQFTEADRCSVTDPTAPCLDRRLQFFGIPLAETTPAAGTAQAPLNDGSRDDIARRMNWLTEPRFLARYFFDPVAFHSSEPDRAGQTTVAFQEQAWAFFGLPQGGSQRMVLRSPNKPSEELWPLLHSFVAQRFQKGGLELFLEDPAEGFDPAYTLAADPGRGLSVLFDPTIVPGDGVAGCVTLTAVGLLAREIGIDRLIPLAESQPVPPDPNPKPFFIPFIPKSKPEQYSLQFEIDGTSFAADEPITILLDPLPVSGAVRQAASFSVHVPHAFHDGSFVSVITAVIGKYIITARGDKSGLIYSPAMPIDLSIPTIDPRNTATCQVVGL